MARTRQIDPIFPFENEIRALSIPARYFYILSWCHMSDPNKEKSIVGGVLPHDKFLLKNNIFPEDGIDILPLINEIIAQRRYFPFEAEGKRWLWCPTMPKHQTVNHPSNRKYPDPPKALQEDYRSGKLALTPSRVELSRVERVENKDKAGPSEELKAALNKIFQDKFNIFTLIAKIKKELKWDKGQEFPEEVLLKVCEAYWRDKPKIKQPWPWFRVVLTKESEMYFASKNIKEHAAIKKQGSMSLAEILKRAQG